MVDPVRIRLSRRKGWRMPENTVKVARGRGSSWGNPFVVTEKVRAGVQFSGAAFGCVAVPTIEDAVACYRLFLGERPDLVAKAQSELRGKNLACWCKPGAPCHGDVLLELANAPICEEVC